ncbi:MAG: hypothetical protein AB1847_00880 [bacterium]
MNKDSKNQAPQLSSLLHLEKFYTLGLMTHRIAHEINNSIQGMLLVLNLLETEYYADENIALLNQEVHEMKELLRSILTYVRADGLEFEPMDLAAVIRETITLLNDLTRDPSFAEINVRYPPSGLLRIDGNFFCLQLALLSLLLYCGQSRNGSSSHARIEIEILTDPSSPMHTVHIRSSCEHMTADETPDSASYAGEARFSLVQRALDLHKGTFRALQEHEGGVCFIMQFPATECQE